MLGGVKVDGDTINITSDGVISTQKVDLSGVATKVELEEVENKIPDTSGLATKSELATVESKIPDTSGLATKVELGEVMTSIPDVSGFATKDEIPNVSGLATKVELNEVAATIPNSDDFATKAELNAVQSSIPDTTGLATKVELSAVEGSIPSEYLKNASVADNKLTITKSSGNTIEFSGGGEKIIEFSTSPVGGATQADSAAAQKVKDKLQFIIDTGKDNILKDYKIIIDGVFITAVNIDSGDYATINFYTCGRQSNRFINFRCNWYEVKDYSILETKKYIFDVSTSSIITGEEISSMIPKWEVAEQGTIDWHLFDAKELALLITDGIVYISLYYNFSYDKDNVWTPTTLGQGYIKVPFQLELNSSYGNWEYDGTEIILPYGFSFVRVYYKT